MTVRFFDSFDHYAFSDVLKKWTAAGSTGTITTASANTRNGVGGALSVSNGQNFYLRKDSLPNASTYICACNLKVTSSPADCRLATFYDNGVTQVSVRLNGTSFICYRGDSDTTISGLTGSNSFTANVYHHIEIKVTVNSTTGYIEIRVDGTNIFSGSNLNTQGSGTTNINGVGPGTSVTGNVGSNGCQLYIDDFLALDSAGSTNNDFLGDRCVYTLFANGAGAHTQWTPDSGSNYARVNEASADGDTSYVSDSTPGHIDSYTFQNLPLGVAAITAVQTNLWARKDDALNTRAITPLERYGGTDALGTASGDLPTTYTDVRALSETSLVNSGSPWTVTEIGAEFGVELTT
jgi:hypothetical protein